MNTFLDQLKPKLPALSALLLIALGHYFHFFAHWLSLSPPEAVALAILLVTALLWITEALPLYVTSLGVLLACLLWLYPVLVEAGIDVDKGHFYQAFFDDITLLFMGGFVLSALLNKYGLARRMANWVIAKTGSEPSRVLLGIMLISSVLSMWMSNTATAAMMFAIISPVIMKIPGTSPFGKGLALAIPFACNIDGMGTPIGTPPNAIAMDYLERAGTPITFAGWMLMSIPLAGLLLFLLWRLLLRWYPPGTLTLDLELESDEERFSFRQYTVMGIFGLAILGWLSSGITGLSTGVVGLIIVILAFGTSLLQQADFRNISWDILFMLGGGLCLGVALQKSGLTATLAAGLPMGSGLGLLLPIVLLLAATMTTFMSNTATANLLIPIAASFPGNELILSVAIAFMCSSSMALPVSTPPNAIAFGSGLLQAKDMFVSGMVVTLIALLATLAACWFYLPLFF